MNVFTVRYTMNSYGRTYDGHRLLVAESAEAALAAFAAWFEAVHNRYVGFATGGKRSTFERAEVAETTLSEFYDRCAGHDWYHEMSDDHGVWSAGERDNREIEAMIVVKGDAWREIWSGFKAHYYSGAPWGTEQVAKPKRPS